MIRKNLYLYIFFASWISVAGQYFDYNHYYALMQTEKKSSTQFGFNTNGFLASNSLNQRLAFALIQGGYINDEVKSSPILKDKNFLDSDFGNTFFINRIGKKAGFRFAVSNRSIINTAFSHDAYNLMFFGNKMYEGKTASLSGLEMDVRSYMKIQTGYVYRKESKKSIFTHFFGASFIDGVEYVNLRFNTLDVYTAPNGETINIDADIQYNGTDSMPSKWYNIRGAGAALDYFFAYEGKKNGIRFTFTASDLGFISWKNNYHKVSIDTIYNFEGVDIDILNPGEVSTGFSQDTLMNIFYSNSAPYKKTSILPGIVSFTFDKKFGKVFEIGLGSDYVLQSRANIPMTYMNMRFHFGKMFILRTLVGYGYYDNVNFGLGADISLFKFLYMRVGSNNLFGYLYSSNSFSQNYYASLMMRF